MEKGVPWRGNPGRQKRLHLHSALIVPRVADFDVKEFRQPWSLLGREIQNRKLSSDTFCLKPRSQPENISILGLLGQWEKLAAPDSMSLPKENPWRILPSSQAETFMIILPAS